MARIQEFVLILVSIAVLALAPFQKLMTLSERFGSVQASATGVTQDSYALTKSVPVPDLKEIAVSIKPPSTPVVKPKSADELKVAR